MRAHPEVGVNAIRVRTIKNSNRKSRNELTWHRPTSRWRKRKNVNGQTKYFYYSYPNTERGYRSALADWKRDLQNIEQAQQEQSHRERNLRARTLAAMEAKRKDAHPDWTQTFRQIVRDLDAGHDLDEAEKRAVTLMYARGNLREGNYEKASQATALLAAEGDDNSQPLFDKLLDEYLEAQRRRVEHGKKHPSAPRRERMRETTYITLTWTVKSLRESLGKKHIPADERRVAKLIRDYRDEQVDLLNSDTIKPNTFNERIKILRHALGWAYESYRLEALPRNLAELCAKYQYEPSAKSIDTKIIRKLFSAANGKMKCFIALALNCGFYGASDIATLERKHIQDGYLIRPRGKTGVPTRFKLWDVTKQLLAEHANQTGKLAFTNANGRPLATNNLTTGTRSDNIRSAFWRLCRKLKIEEITFSNLRDTSSTHIENIDSSLTDVFEGHSDKRMARFYVDAEKVDWSRLDAVLGRLEREYGLKVEGDAK